MKPNEINASFYSTCTQNNYIISPNHIVWSVIVKKHVFLENFLGIKLLSYSNVSIWYQRYPKPYTAKNIMRVCKWKLHKDWNKKPHVFHSKA